jgi:hypothetical protein
VNAPASRVAAQGLDILTLDVDAYGSHSRGIPREGLGLLLKVALVLGATEESEHTDLIQGAAIVDTPGSAVGHDEHPSAAAGFVSQANYGVDFKALH